jgi:hypothetical protein
MSSDLSADEIKIIDKRLETLLGIWDKVSRVPCFAESDDTVLHLNEKLLGEVLACYIYDLRALKQCYEISDKVQFPKIAGLMTNAIVKYKPLVPRNGDDNLKAISLKANEIFATFYGLCVLFDTEILPDGEIRVKVVNSIKNFIKTNPQWQKNVHYLLHSRNYTAESLITMFETLCITLAPELLEYKGEG